MKDRLLILENSGMITSKISNQVLDTLDLLVNKYQFHAPSTEMFLTHLAVSLARHEKGEVVEPVGKAMRANLEGNKCYPNALEVITEMEELIAVNFDKTEHDYFIIHLCNLFQDKLKKRVSLVDGYTYIHEHVTIDLSKIKNNPDTNLDCFDDTVAEFQELYKLGVRNIVDVTAIGMGRNVEYVEEVARLSGIQILHATGFYKEPFLPDFVYEKSIEELAEMMVIELMDGINGSGVKASLIGEIGTSLNTMEDMEKKVFDASILAAKRTNCVISTHTTLGSYALEQAHYLIESGIKPAKIIIGHQDLSQNLEQILELLKLGVNVAFDTIGKDNYFPDTERVEFLKVILEQNYIDQIVLSLDITRKSHLKVNGGIGYDHLITKFLPMLEAGGITTDSIEKMLRLNPQRIFQGD